MHPVLFHLASLVVPAYGGCAAVGVLAALWLAERDARRAQLPAGAVWNLLIAALAAAIVSGRLLLVLLNLPALIAHPAWIAVIAMVHHPLLAIVGIVAAALVGLGCAWFQRMPLRTLADVLAAPLLWASAAEQSGAFLAGSGFGVAARGVWMRVAVVATAPEAARWSATPLGVPLVPVQLFAAAGFAVAAALLGLGRCWRRGDRAALALALAAVVVFFTEFLRDPEGRGRFFFALVDGPQLVAVAMLLASAALAAEWPSRK